MDGVKSLLDSLRISVYEIFALTIPGLFALVVLQYHMGGFTLGPLKANPQSTFEWALYLGTGFLLGHIVKGFGTLLGEPFQKYPPRWNSVPRKLKAYKETPEFARLREHIFQMYGFTALSDEEKGKVDLWSICYGNVTPTDLDNRTRFKVSEDMLANLALGGGEFDVLYLQTSAGVWLRQYADGQHRTAGQCSAPRGNQCALQPHLGLPLAGSENDLSGFFSPAL